MEFLEALRLLAIGQRYGFADVSSPVCVKKRSQAAPADLEGHIPQTALDFVNRQTVGQRRSRSTICGTSLCVSSILRTLRVSVIFITGLLAGE